jgi:CHAT domain-containing protein
VWNERLSKLQAALLRAPITRRGVEPRSPPETEADDSSPSGAEPRILQECGEELFNVLFVKKIYAALDKHWGEADKAGAALRIRLRIEAPQLSYLPWETLYNGKDFLSLSPKTPVVRSPSDDGFQEPVPPPLCILGMVPRFRGFGSVDLASLDVEAEQANIEDALRELKAKNQAHLGWTLTGNPEALIDRLEQPPEGSDSWHVFHFIGHGGYDKDEKKGYVVVDPDPDLFGIEPTGDEAQALFADDLKHILQIPSNLRLVVLNSCKGAARLPGAVFASAAETLVSEGFSAVVAMQFEISDRAANIFSAELYRRLAAGETIHRAVTLARMRLKRLKSPEWITPVLYMRTRDGRLFRDVAC